MTGHHASIPAVGSEIEPSPRARLAGLAGRWAMRVSRSTGRGRGSSVGGRIALRIAPSAMSQFGRGRTTVLIVGTNGKTTTNLLVVSALSALGPIAANVRGSNKREGLTAALVDSPRAPYASLEVAEIDAPHAITALDPAAVILLNLSNEQSDRADDLRAVKHSLRESLTGRPGTVLVANCDDVNIASIAYDAPHVVWVSCGAARLDRAVTCPRCGEPIAWSAPDKSADSDTWSCTGCALTRPDPDWDTADGILVGPEGFRTALTIRLPGRANRGNAAQAVAAAAALGVEPHEAVRRVSAVDDVADRYRIMSRGPHFVRTMMAKNPVGAQECLSMIASDLSGLVIAVNGRPADSEDMSWLWDVDYSRVATGGSPASKPGVIVASGERAADLSVRLFHAGVEHVVNSDVMSAIAQCPAGRVDVLADYTATTELARAFESAETATQAEAGSPSLPPRAGKGPPIAGLIVPADRLTKTRAGGTSSTPGTGMHRRSAADTSTVRIGLLLPSILGAGGDGGNAVVLRDRLRLRGHRAEVFRTTFDDPAPSSFDIYVVGGPERAELELAFRILQARGALSSVVDRGVPVLAASGGVQILGHRFRSQDGRASAGLGLIDCRTDPPGADAPPRITGNVLAHPLHESLTEPLIGFENHVGRTAIGAAAAPLARVARGTGNGIGADRLEGVVHGSVIGTHLHGPVLAYNPELADLLCARALGLRRPDDLPALEVAPVSRLRTDRLR